MNGLVGVRENPRQRKTPYPARYTEQSNQIFVLHNSFLGFANHDVRQEKELPGR